MSQAASSIKPFDIEEIRKDFPVLHQEVNNHPLVYFDNAASSQKPVKVIQAITDYYTHYHSNIHRGVHFLSDKATNAYEEARIKAQKFINAGHTHEINFVKGTTEGINLVATALGRKLIQAGDEILITEMEHHSNIVPWQMLCEEKKAVLKVGPINDRGELMLEDFFGLISEKTKLIAIAHVSNTLGTINPVKQIIEFAHKQNIPVLLDGAQATPHMPVDVQDLDCDFYTFSGHKVMGPTGIGILYGKEKWLEFMDPYQGGGEMIETVTFEKTIYNELPYKFEAGTPNIAGAIALGYAFDYIHEIGWDALMAYEEELLDYALYEMHQISGIRFIGQAADRAGVISFILDGHHPYDVGVLLDKMGIAIRTGHLCTEPLMHHFGITGTCRASFAFYNTKQEIDLFIQGLKRVKTILG
jgi:cysteine desulfurase / selenocysteine lyase